MVLHGGGPRTCALAVSLAVIVGRVGAVEAQGTEGAEARATARHAVSDVTVQADAGREDDAEAVTSVDLHDARSRTADLGEVLARQPGVSVQRSGGLGSSARIGLAGLGGARLRVFVDGVPLELTGLGVGLADVPAGLLERVEVHRGVVPIRFGADALGGVIDLVRRQPTGNVAATASLLAGSWATYRVLGDVSLRDPATSIEGGLAVYVDHARNDYPIDVELASPEGRLTAARVRRFHDAYTAWGAMGRVGVRGLPWARVLSLTLHVRERDKDLAHDAVMTRPFGAARYGEAALGGTLLYEVEPLRGLRIGAVLAYTHRALELVDVSRDVFDWTGRVVRRRRLGGEIDGTPIDAALREHDVLARVTASYRLSGEHTLALASSASFTSRTGTDRLFDREGRDPASARRDVLRVSSGLEWRAMGFEEVLEGMLFVKHHAFVSDAEVVRPGLVFDRARREVHQPGVGGGLVVRPHEAVAIEASYEYAARLPSADELYGDGQLVAASLELRPETSHNTNLELRLALRAPELGELRWSALGFWREASELIVLLGNERQYQYVNVLGARSLGAQTSLAWEAPQRWLRVEASGTYLDLRSTSHEGPFGAFAGDRIPSEPWLFGHVGARLSGRSTLRRDDEAWFGADVRYVEGFFRGWESQGLTAFKQTVDAQLVLSLGVGYRLPGPPDVTASLEVSNLTDARVYDVFGVQRPGRSVYVRVTASY